MVSWDMGNSIPSLAASALFGAYVRIHILPHRRAVRAARPGTSLPCSPLIQFTLPWNHTLVRHPTAKYIESVL